MFFVERRYETSKRNCSRVANSSRPRPCHRMKALLVNHDLVTPRNPSHSFFLFLLKWIGKKINRLWLSLLFFVQLLGVFRFFFQGDTIRNTRNSTAYLVFIAVLQFGECCSSMQAKKLMQICSLVSLHQAGGLLQAFVLLFCALMMIKWVSLQRISLTR